MNLGLLHPEITKATCCLPHRNDTDPILNGAGEVLAVIQLINKATALRFTEQDEDLLCAFGGQIGSESHA